jgi:predicted GTPase
MTVNIDFADHLDVRDLGDIAETEYDLVTDREADGDGRLAQVALDTLDALQSMLNDLGMGYVPYEEVADKLRGLAATTNPTLYAAGFFVEAMKEYVEDIGDLPSELPSYVVIDWEATAAGLREGYSSVYLDGNEYLIRRS